MPAVLISSVNEIPNIVRDTHSKRITLIHKDDDLIKCCVELIEASGYLPKLHFRLTELQISVLSSMMLKLGFKPNT